MPPLMTNADADVLATAAAQVTAHVQAGVAFLDRVRPGWDEHINLGLLNVASSDCCIIGQVTNRELVITQDSDKAFELWARLIQFGRTRGFQATTLLPSLHEYAMLTAEWRRVITLRRQAAAVVAA